MEELIHFFSKLSQSEVGMILVILITPIILGEILFFKLIIVPALEMFKTSVFDIQNKTIKLLNDIEASMIFLRQQINDLNKLMTTIAYTLDKNRGSPKSNSPSSKGNSNNPPPSSSDPSSGPMLKQ